MNPTMEKFGYPATLVQDLDHWCVLLRVQQATLGSLVLACKENAEAFSDISEGAFTELASATRQIETSLQAFRPYQKINYLMLMMVDPHVHFHVIPRYEAPQEFAGVEFADPGWPAVPALSNAVSVEGGLREELLTALKVAWAG
ncbi:MAG: HIT family protein [Rhizobiales bacterium]|nr:HIT family protein [Hyphomicrobiales bacterium]